MTKRELRLMEKVPIEKIKSEDAEVAAAIAKIKAEAERVRRKRFIHRHIGLQYREITPDMLSDEKWFAMRAECEVKKAKELAEYIAKIQAGTPTSSVERARFNCLLRRGLPANRITSDLLSDSFWKDPNSVELDEFGKPIPGTPE